MGQTAFSEHEPGSASPSVASAPLTVEEVIKKLQESNAERAAALDQYQATRVYRMHYRGFPSNRDAEMVVEMTYNAPNSKEFKVVSASGAKFIIELRPASGMDGESAGETAAGEAEALTVATTKAAV